MPSSYCGLLLVLLALFQDMAVSSPIHHHHRCKWEEIKDHARTLSDLAMKFYNSTQANDNVVLDIPRIQCEHRCGPQDLSSNKTTCLQHIHHVLSFYKRVLDALTENDLKNYDKKNDIIHIKKVLSNLVRCLEAHSVKTTTIPPIEATSDFVKKRFGTPLASSSSLIARVFAVGDPSNHWPARKQ
ncbi:interleukin-23 subunit alpha [Rana temporaria]|uniref:interleukin-23 subunit alpha n=1 Tax=Rana temporaria TaxID=8407 RepID=UPI001AACAD72|nr:interleukin-23 subunit alpha [Rana temporaria]